MSTNFLCAAIWIAETLVPGAQMTCWVHRVSVFSPHTTPKKGKETKSGKTESEENGGGEEEKKEEEGDSRS